MWLAVVPKAWFKNLEIFNRLENFQNYQVNVNFYHKIFKIRKACLETKLNRKKDLPGKYDDTQAKKSTLVDQLIPIGR